MLVRRVHKIVEMSGFWLSLFLLGGCSSETSSENKEEEKPEEIICEPCVGSFIVTDDRDLKAVGNQVGIEAIQHCSHIEGSISFHNIESAQIDLPCLETVSEVLSISTTKLESLRAFDQVREVGGLNITHNYALKEEEIFQNLETIRFTTFLFSYNFNLKTLSGFPKLKTSNGISIINNQDLQDISAFNSLENISGLLHIGSNKKLQKITGFQNLERITNGKLDKGSLKLVENDLLKELGFPKLQTIGSDLYLVGNEGLETIDLLALQTVLNQFQVSENKRLQKFELPNLHYVGSGHILRNKPICNDQIEDYFKPVDTKDKKPFMIANNQTTCLEWSKRDLVGD